MRTIDIWSHLEYTKIMGKSTKVSEIELINQSIGCSMVAPIFSSMTLRGETPPKSSSIGGRKISPQKLFKTIADIFSVYPKHPYLICEGWWRG